MSAKRKPARKKAATLPGKAKVMPIRELAYTEALGDEVCEAVATSTRGLAAICAASPTLPTRKTIHKWLSRIEAFGDKYAKAKAKQMLLMGEEIIDIADDSSRDTIDAASGPQANSEWIARSRLRVDTRKWLMSKLAPKVYGERLGVEHSGEIRTHMTLEQFRERVSAAKANRPAA